MKKKLLILLLITLAATLCFAACNKPLPDELGIKSIKLIDGSVPTEYNVGDTPDFSGIRVEITFDDGTTKEIGYSDVQISPLDTSTAGEKKVTVTYGGHNFEFTVNVKEANEEATLTSIKIVPGTISTTLFMGQTLDVSRLQIEATYSDGTKKAISAENVEISSIDTSSAGEKTLTVTFGGLTDSIKITVLDITEMTVVSGTVADKVFVGENLDTSRIQLLVKYSDGRSEIVGADSINVGEFDTTTHGKKTLEIKYNGATIQHPIEVVGEQSITVLKGSVQSSVKVFDTLDTSGIKATLLYTDGTKKELTANHLTVGAFDTETAGKKQLKVTYGSLETTVEIEVVGVKSITVMRIASEIIKGETLDLSNIQASVIFTDNSAVVLEKSSLTLGTVDTTTGGEKKLTVTYLDKTVEYTVKVCEITSIRVSGINTVLQAGERPNLNNMKVWGIYNNSNETEIELDINDVTTNYDEIDWNTGADKELVVKYDGEYGTLQTVVKISATAPALTDLEIRNYAQLVAIGDAYNKSSVVAYAVYDNGTKQRVDVTVEDVDTTKAGEITVTVSYTEGDVSKTATATVKVLPVTGIIVSGVDSRIMVGEVLDTSAIKATVYFGSGDETIVKVVDITNEDLIVSDVDTTESGNKEVTVTYFGFEEKVNVEVVGVTSIEVLGGVSDKLLQGGIFSADNIRVQITFTDGTATIVDASKLTLGNINSAEAGEQKLTVEYLDGLTEYTVTVYAITEIRIEGVDKYLPAGNKLNFDAITVYGYNENVPGERIEITEFEINLTDKDDAFWNSEENKELVVTYGELEAKFEIIATDAELEGIEIDSYDKIVALGGVYNTNNVIVNAVYGNGAKKPVKATVSDIVTTIAGDVTLTVTYTVGEGEDAVEYTATAIVKVLPITKLGISGVANKIYFGDRLDVSNIVVKVTFSDGTEENVIVRTLAEDEAEVSVNDVEGDDYKKTLTITYLGFEKTFDVTVVGVDSIEVISGLVSEILPGQTIDVSEMVVEVTFADETTKTLGKADLDNVTVNNENGEITMTYLDKTETHNVKVCEIVRLEVSGIETVLPAGKEPDLSLMTVKGRYNDANNTAVTITEFTTNFVDVNWDSEEDRILTVTYGELSIDVTITATAPEFIGLEIERYDNIVALGDDYNENSVIVWALYGNNTRKVVEATISEVITSAAGDVTFTASYTEGDVTKTATANVKVLPITKLEISGVANKIYFGDELDTSGIVIKATFSDGENEIIRTLSKNDVEISVDSVDGDDYKKTLTVTYLGKEEALDVTVVGVASIEVLSGIVSEILPGQTIDVSGIRVKITFADNTTKTLGKNELGSVTADNETGVVTITYLDKTATYNVKVCEIVRIEIVYGVTGLPAGQKPDLSTMTVYKVYNDVNGTRVAVDNYTTNIDSLDWNKEGNKDIVVEWEGFTTTHRVNSSAPVLERIEITAYDKYVVLGGTYNKGSVVVWAYYGNGTSKQITPGLITDITTETDGKKALSVTYTENGVVQTATADVSVLPVTKLEISGIANKVYWGDELDASGIIVNVTFSDGVYTVNGTVTFNDVTLGVFNTNTVGKSNLSVTYRGETENYEIEVVGVSNIEVVGGIVDEILLGNEISVDNIQVKITYTDGTTANINKDKLTIDSVNNETGVISITYLDKTVTHTVKVCTITSIIVEGIKTTVEQGENTGNITNGIKVYGVYNDKVGTHVELPISDINVNDGRLIDTNVIGTHTLTVKYGQLEETVEITVKAPVLESIKITEFDQFVGIGTSYDKNSVKVIAKYSNSSEATVNATISDVNTDVAGNVTLTVTYTEKDITKTAEAIIQILPVSEIVSVSGIDNLVNKGATLDTSKVQLTVEFSDGSRTITDVVAIFDGVTVTTPDTATGGDKTLTVSFGGKSTTFNYHVKAVASFEIYSGLADVYREGYDYDFSALKLFITYTNGDEEVKSASALSGVATSLSDSKLVTVTYEGKSVTKQLVVASIYRVHALNGTVPDYVFVGDKVSFENFKLTVEYRYKYNGEDRIEVYLIGKDDPNLTIIPSESEFDTTVAGDKIISFFYMKDTVTDAFGNPVWQAQAKIVVKGISSIEIVHGTVPNTLNVGQEFDITDIQVKVIYTDNTFAYVYLEHLESNSGLDTSTAGEKTFTVTYNGHSASIKVQVVSVGANANEGAIFGALLPDSIVARDAYKNNYRNQNEPYYVGNDNPYYLYLNVAVLDENMELVDVDGKTVPTAVTVYEVTSSGEVKLEGDALSAVVTFNSSKNSYQFTDAALNRVFRLEICPADESRYAAVGKDAVTKSHTVKVVDGYNVYEAWELNIITNNGTDLDGNDNETKIIQYECVDRFLADKGVTRPQSLAGIIIHGNLNVTIDDLPPEYFCEYTKDGKTQKNLYDHFGIFSRLLDESGAGKSFTVYGNYYSIYSYNLPCVSHKGFANNDDEFSSVALIMLKGRNGYASALKTKYDNTGIIPYQDFSVNVKDLSMRDNDPNSNDQSASERHIRGMSGFMFGRSTANVTNVNIDAFMISASVEGGNTWLNLDKVRFYNAWQGHLFLWAQNYYQNELKLQKQETLPEAKPITVDIKESFLAKCGGPVILAQSDDRDYASNHNMGIDVNVDGNSTLYSYVTGQEAWFVALNQTPLAGQIVAMNQLVKASSGGTASYTSDKFIKGINTVNMVMVNMGTGLDSIGGGDEYSGTYTEDGVVGLNMTASYNTIKDKNTMLDMYKSATGGQAPIFQTSAGGTAYTDGATGCFGLETGAPGAPQSNFLQGKYITVYYQGIGIMLEYYNPTNPEPAN